MKKEKEELTQETSPLEESALQENKVWKIIKLILLIITSPIWFPWKILFVRRKGHKYKDMSTGIRVFRIIRSPITIPLKFILYLCIIGLEVLIIYKVRYSFITYPITKGSVQTYFLKSDFIADNQKEELQKSFNHIDNWDLDSKNKMYVLLDSYVAKSFLENSNNQTLDLFLDKFNNDNHFRENVHDIAKNVDKTVSRAIEDMSSNVDNDELNTVLGASASIGAKTIDYRQALDILGEGIKIIGEEELKNIEIDEKNIDETISSIASYSRGASIEELTKQGE